MNPTATVVLCTCPNTDVAKELAGVLLEKKLAACVNLIPGVTSLYHWQGKLCEDSEVQMVIKTERHLLPQLEQSISNNHPYEVPEIIALPVGWGHQSYLEWITQSCINDTA